MGADFFAIARLYAFWDCLYETALQEPPAARQKKRAPEDALKRNAGSDRLGLPILY
jgi:hypothetical protein